MEPMKSNHFWAIMIMGVCVILISGFCIRFFSIGSRPAWVANTVIQGITVNGEGSIAVKPDIARVTLGMEAVAATAGEAQNKNAATMARIINGVKLLGIAAKDIQTTDFSLFPERRFDKTTGQDLIAGYRAVNQVAVTVRDLAKLGAAIDESIQNGANNVENVSFAVETPGKWRDAAITKAVQEARAKAESLAKASGLRIKRIIAMSESAIDIRPYQMNYNLKKADALSAGESVSTPLEPGNVKITASVQMNFGI